MKKQARRKQKRGMPGRTWWAALCLVPAAIACGQIKSRGDKVVVVHDSPSSQAASDAANLPANLRQIDEFIQLYFDGDGINRTGLTNLFDRYRDQLGAILGGTSLAPAQLIDLIFKFDANQDGRVTVTEISEGVQNRVPTLRWVPDNDTAIDFAELGKQLEKEYPDASPVARLGLQTQLQRFDEPFAGGNGDGKLTRKELATAGLVLGVLAQTDLSHGIDLPEHPGADHHDGDHAGSPPTGGDHHDVDHDGDHGAEQRALVTQLGHKLNQQIYGRYLILDHHNLPPADGKLEWMQLALKFVLVDKLTHYFGAEGQLLPQDQVRALTTYGPPHDVHWEKLRKFYDNKLFNGNQDGKLNTLETFNLVTDLAYADKVKFWVHGDFSARNVSALPFRTGLLQEFLQLYPKVGQGLFMGDREAWNRDHWAIRNEYWDGLENFDENSRGGNEDHKVDTGEFCMALAYARVVDEVYTQYDTDHDGLLSKKEAAPLFKRLGIEESRVIDAFFADIGLEGGSHFWIGVRMFFSADSDIDHLVPFDFHQRLAKVLPRTLNGEHL